MRPAPALLSLSSSSDSACVVWGSRCGATTHCLLYDTDLMRTTIFYMVGQITLQYWFQTNIWLLVSQVSACSLVSTLLDVGVWWNCGHIQVPHSTHSFSSSGF